MNVPLRLPGPGISEGAARMGVSRAEHGASQLMSLSLAQKIWNAMRRAGPGASWCEAAGERDCGRPGMVMTTAFDTQNGNGHCLQCTSCCCLQEATNSQQLVAHHQFHSWWALQKYPSARNTPRPKVHPHSWALGGSLVPWRCHWPTWPPRCRTWSDGLAVGTQCSAWWRGRRGGPAGCEGDRGDRGSGFSIFWRYLIFRTQMVSVLVWNRLKPQIQKWDDSSLGSAAIPVTDWSVFFWPTVTSTRVGSSEVFSLLVSWSGEM